MNLVYCHNFANYTVVIMISFAIIDYQWPICWMICLIQFVRLVISILALTTGNPVYLILTKGARRVWPVSRGYLLLHGTWSCLRICRRCVLPYTRFCNCLLDYDYVLHTVNFAIFVSLCSEYLSNCSITWYKYCYEYIRW
jgi:hypothetical protein